MLGPADFLDRAMKQNINKTLVAHSRFEDTLVWSGLIALNVATILMSPPSRPWSNVGTKGGLAMSDRQLFTKTLRRAGQAQMRAVAAENVKGFSQHPEFSTVIGAAAMDGLQLISDGVFRIERALPAERERWLGVLVNSSINVENDLVKKAKEVSFSNPVYAMPMPGPTLRDRRAIHVNVTAHELSNSQPCSIAKELMSRPDLLPRWLANCGSAATPDAILKRAIPSLAHLTCFTGDMQGRTWGGTWGGTWGWGHAPQEQGWDMGWDMGSDIELHLHRANTLPEEAGRYFSRWELFCAMGFPPNVILSPGLRDAFQQCGNAISPLHAWLAIAKIAIILGSMFPFSGECFATRCVLVILEDTMTLSCFVAVVDGNFWFLRPLVTFHDAAESLPPAKRAKLEITISPTVPMEPGCEFATKNLGSVPNFQAPMVSGAGSNQPLVMFMHHQNNWCSVAHTRPQAVLSDLINRVLPHAVPEHFISFHIDKLKVEWSETIACFPQPVVTFAPVTKPISGSDGDVSQALMLGDVTWATETVLAFMASRLQCNVNSLQLRHEDHEMLSGEILFGYEPLEFCTAFKAFMPGYVAFAPEKESVIDPGFSPTDPSSIRFVAKHPQKKTIRTVCCQMGNPVSVVVRALFPELRDALPWKLHEHMQEIDPGMSIAAPAEFQIEWDCFNPLPVTRVAPVCYSQPVDSMRAQIGGHAFQPRWVRSPFKAKPDVLRLNDATPVMQIAASYVAAAKCEATIICQMGSTIIDPLTKIGNLPVTEVLSFRVLPLLEGGKPIIKDAFKWRFKQIFETHGVSKDAVDLRLSDFQSKVDLETLLKDQNADDSSLWNTVKGEANRVHFRLVYRSENKVARQNSRRRKPPSKEPRKNHQMPKEDFVANASNIWIDMSHFWDGEENVQQLDPSRFGPEQHGVAIMTLQEADRHSSCNPASMNALAILVVGRKFGPSNEVFTMPAFTHNDTPVIIKAALRSSLTEVQRKASTIEKALRIIGIKDQFAIRTKREHTGAVRSCVLPESACVAKEIIEPDEHRWLLKNVPVQIGTADLGLALQQAEHLCINGTCVLVEPIKKPAEQGAITFVARQYNVGMVVQKENQTVQIAQSSRFHEFKAEISEHFENRLATANARIEQLANKLENTQTPQAQSSDATKAELAELRDE
eukprot:Skav210648  [mRNA]  locus=scaffold2527:46960:51702:- [translate_table: standard]